MSRVPRWSVRARLTALVAAVFTIGGTVLLGVQYLMVQYLFSSVLSDLGACFDASGQPIAGRAANGTCVALTEVTSQQLPSDVVIDPNGPAVMVDQGLVFSQEVLSRLLVGSVITLAVFAVGAVLVANWLTRRSFARIGQIADTARRITGQDLHQRLRLAGPSDEIKDLGDTIDMMLDRLEASFTRQQRFIANASHELRTPLTTTRAALEIPLDQGRVPAELEPAFRRALAANERSEALIAALLNLARATNPHDSDPAGRGPLDLAHLVKDSAERHRALAEPEDISISVQARPASVTGVDATLLTMAIDNLVDNAIRHNVAGGSVHLTTGSTAGQAWAQVTNSGALMTAEEARRLTEPFNRGMGTRLAAGGRSLGLGLTLVENIVTAAGGSLEVSPADGGGLSVRVEFPQGGPGLADGEPASG